MQFWLIERILFIPATLLKYPLWTVNSDISFIIWRISLLFRSVWTVLNGRHCRTWELAKYLSMLAISCENLQLLANYKTFTSLFRYYESTEKGLLPTRVYHDDFNDQNMEEPSRYFTNPGKCHYLGRFISIFFNRKGSFFFRSLFYLSFMY